MTEIGSVYVRGDGNTVNEPELPQGNQRASHTGLFELEPCAVKVARTVLRGGRSEQSAFPTRLTDSLRIGLTELLRKAQMEEDADFLREGMRVFAQAVMELEVTQHVGAERHARTDTRIGQRNGYRERAWDTRVGTIDLQVPRVRDGGYFPALLDPRRRAERALTAVVQQAYVAGVSTRRVDNLVQALGMTGISKSQGSRLCEGLDAEVDRFRTRPLVGAHPYLWLDATYLKVRQDGRVVSLAVMIAIAVNDTGRREVLGVDVGPSEEEAGALVY